MTATPTATHVRSCAHDRLPLDRARAWRPPARRDGDGATELSRRERDGVLLCLLSAAGFGAMAIFAKLAYEAGFDIGAALALRFALAALVLWAIVAVRRPRRASRRTIAIAVGLGGVGYALQAGGYFASLRHIDASLTALLLYTYPALVFVGAVMLRRERVTRRRVGALVLASGGTLLVLAGGGAGTLDPVGVAFALGAAVAYTGYILVADTAVGDIDPYLLSAIIVSAAAVSVGAVSVAAGGLHLAGIERSGWAAIAGVVLVSTVMPIIAFLLGLDRVGPSTASIVSTLEPVVTVALAIAVFGETLGPIQGLGGALVIAAIVVLNLGRSRRSRGRTQPVEAEV